MNLRCISGDIQEGLGKEEEEKMDSQTTNPSPPSSFHGSQLPSSQSTYEPSSQETYTSETSEDSIAYLKAQAARVVGIIQETLPSVSLPKGSFYNYKNSKDGREIIR